MCATKEEWCQIHSAMARLASVDHVLIIEMAREDAKFWATSGANVKSAWKWKRVMCSNAVLWMGQSTNRPESALLAPYATNLRFRATRSGATAVDDFIAISSVQYVTAANPRINVASGQGLLGFAASEGVGAQRTCVGCWFKCFLCFKWQYRACGFFVEYCTSHIESSISENADDPLVAKAIFTSPISQKQAGCGGAMNPRGYACLFRFEQWNIGNVGDQNEGLHLNHLFFFTCKTTGIKFCVHTGSCINTLIFHRMR